jgi:hypothetical protein
MRCNIYFYLNKKFSNIVYYKMSRVRNAVINPLTGRTIQIGGSVYNQLLFDAYDHINSELVRRETAPPPSPRQYYLNTETNQLIYACGRRYFELMRNGWEIEEDYYLIPPWRSVETQAILARAERKFTRRLSNNTPLSYEQIMETHRDRLVELNITLCKNCLIPIKLEERPEHEYCNDCTPSE